MPRAKKPRGRPSSQVKPEPIPDKPTNIIRALLRTRSKVERALLSQRGKNAPGPA